MSEVQGSLVTFKYSTDITEPIAGYKTIVCEESSEGGMDSNTTETKTKCGTFTSVDSPTSTITGNGVVKIDPASDEGSFQEILNLINNKTKVSGLYENAADVSVGASQGEAVYMKGQGRFTSARVTSTEGDLLKFSWAFSYSGTVDTNPNS